MDDPLDDTCRLPRGAEGDRLVLLPNHAMRARRCSRAVAALWVWEVLAGVATAWPVVAVVRSVYGSHPHADAILWEPGGLALLDLLVRSLPLSGALLAHLAVVAIFVAFIGVLLASALFVCIGFGDPDGGSPGLRRALLASLPAFGPSAAIFATALVFEASLAAASLTLAGLAATGFERSLGDVAADGVALSLVGVCAAAAAVAGVLQDVARAAIVRTGTGVREGVRTALRALSTSLIWSWGWRAVASVVPIGFGALLAERLGGRGGFSLTLLFAVHQAVILARTALRASWLARAMRAVDAVSRPLHTHAR
jgi:hypothetical protein